MSLIEEIACRIRRIGRVWLSSPLGCWRRTLLGMPGRDLLRAYQRFLDRHEPDAPPTRLQILIERGIRRKLNTRGAARIWRTAEAPATEKELRHLKERACIVLKSPRFDNGHVVERGAFLIKHTKRFPLFCGYIDMEAFLQHYFLILEPSWAGYANVNILRFTWFRDHPIIVLAPSRRDFEFVKRLATNLVPVRCGPSDWVDHAVFRPLDGVEKQYDAVLVARFAPYKRHDVLFRVLRDLADPSLKVALVAPPMPPRREEMEELIDTYGIADNVSIFQRAPQSEVNRILNQSKVNVLLSLKEGGNKSLFEGFFAGVPGLALKNNIGIPKDYFNSQTGKLIDEEDLASELLYFREHWREFDPRSWAMEHIAPEVTTAKLNALLKQFALERGEEWTQGIVAKRNCPNPAYYPDESAGDGLPSLKDIVLRYAQSDDVRRLADTL